MRILLLAEGNPETWDSWSGSSRGLLRALRAQGHDVIAGDVSEPAWRQWPNILRNWVPDRRHWAARYHFGPIGFRNRGRRAEALLARHAGDIDAVLQIGATFDALRWADRPGFVYCDSNVRLTARDAPSGEVAALRAFEREQVFARERSVYAGACAVFVMSDYLRRSTVTDFGLAEDRVETVLAGANLDLGALPPLPTTPAGPPTILFVGKQWERKGGPLLLDAFRVLEEGSVRVDDVAVEVRRGTAHDRGLSDLILAVRGDLVLLRGRRDTPRYAGLVEVRRVPRVVLRQLLDVGRGEIGVQVVEQDGDERRASRVIAVDVRGACFPRRRDRAHIGHGSLLLRALHGGQHEMLKRRALGATKASWGFAEDGTCYDGVLLVDDKGSGRT